jgi:hypothetical protein
MKTIIEDDAEEEIFNHSPSVKNRQQVNLTGSSYKNNASSSRNEDYLRR